MQHARADVDRLYVPRARVDRGLKQMERTYNIAVFSIGQYNQYKAGTLTETMCYTPSLQMITEIPLKINHQKGLNWMRCSRRI